MARDLPKLRFSTNIFFFVLFTALFLAGLIFITYTEYIKHGGIIFLPTISETWAIPPGTYISRFFGSILGALLFLSVTITYCVIKHLSVERNKHIDAPSRIYGTAVLGVLLYSWIPGICDTSDVSCRGFSPIHDFCAVMFFVLIDVALLNIYVSFYRPGSSLEKLFLGVLFTFAFASNIRFLPLDQLVGHIHILNVLKRIADSFLAIIEWSNVAIVFILLCIFIWKYREGFKIRIGRFSVAKKTETVMFYFVPSFWGTIAAVLIGVELIFSIVVNHLLGYYSYSNGVPSISELQVHRPANWTTHWAFMYCSICLAGVHYSIAFSNALFVDKRFFKVVNLVMGLFGIGAFIGLGVSGISSTAENWELHAVGSLAFFVLYNLYMLLSFLLTNHRERSEHILPTVICTTCILLSTVSKSRFGHFILHIFGITIDLDLSFRLLEWLDFEVILLFIVAFIRIIEKRLDDIRVMITYSN